ncbi:Cytosolic phospholipase A2 epsilon, partial [Eschrichtius robustus]|nr:Cytosolic phospholipase A2 epsilon [Eschrichtius robustus]
NVLELSVCDEDTVTPDDHFLTVLYDLTKLCFREKTHVKFPLNTEGMEELEVEFLLEERITWELLNPVGAWAPPLLIQVYRLKGLLVTVTESFEHTQHISHCLEPCRPNPACFHYPKYFQPQVHVEVPKSQWSFELSCCGAGKNGPVCQPLDCLRDGQAVTLPVVRAWVWEGIPEQRSLECLWKGDGASLGGPEGVRGKTFKTFQISLRRQRVHSQALDVRLGFSLCQAELEFLQKRRVVVAEALKEVLQLEEDLQADEGSLSTAFLVALTAEVPGAQVPLIAIMATGGGIRSMTAMYGHLLGLQKLNILNCASYITGLSGATWTMATLYRDPDWSSKNLELAILEARRHVVKDKMPALFPDQLLRFQEELQQRRQEGYKVTFTDFWGLLVEACLADEGQNPLPIYLTINVKEDVSNQDFREWFEFSPYEVGLPKYGGFIPTELFGSEFFMGRLMRRIPESRICYMLGDSWLGEAPGSPAPCGTGSAFD